MSTFLQSNLLQDVGALTTADRWFGDMSLQNPSLEILINHKWDSTRDPLP